MAPLTGIVRCALALLILAATAAAGLPPDPPEKGDSTLFVRLLRDRDGMGLRGRIDLWRLDAPGSEHWTRGDQRVHRRLRVPAEGVAIEGLPQGRYRIVLRDQRAGLPDPAPFRVSGARTERSFRVLLPREFEVHLRLVDEGGQPIVRAKMWKSRGYVLDGLRQPDWVVPRRVRASQSPVVYGGGGGAGGSRRRWKLRPTARGLLPLGSFDENRRGRREWRHAHLTVAKRNGILVRVPCAELRPRTYRAVAVPMELLRPLVRLPDGSSAVDAGALVQATCRAVEETGPPAPGWWRRLPIEVRVKLDGYERLRFTYRLDQPPPPQVLAPKPPAE